MRRRHRMPFGAEVLENGETRFALWAPAAETVELVLEDGALPMRREGGDIFTLTAEATPGARYRYRIDGGQEVPDPASRYQPEDVDGPSQVVDPEQFDWGDTSILLPGELAGAAYSNVLTGETVVAEDHEGQPSLRAGSLLRNFPVALLEAGDR